MMKCNEARGLSLFLGFWTIISVISVFISPWISVISGILEIIILIGFGAGGSGNDSADDNQFEMMHQINNLELKLKDIINQNNLKHQ